MAVMISLRVVLLVTRSPNAHIHLPAPLLHISASLKVFTDFVLNSTVGSKYPNLAYIYKQNLNLSPELLFFCNPR